VSWTHRPIRRLHGAHHRGWPRLAVLLAAVTGPLLAPACRGDVGAVRSAGGLELRLYVENAEGEPVSQFAPRETVVLVLAVHNPGPAPIRFELSSTRTHDCAISDEAGRELWRWSRGRRFAQVLTDFSLASGETRRLEARWNQQRDDDRPVPAGRYRATAELAAREAGVPVSAAFTVE
jgi:hypothetical protein